MRRKKTIHTLEKSKGLSPGNHHTELADRWHTFSIFEQMANIGAEVGRSINWKKKAKADMSRNAVFRALELIAFTVSDPKNKDSLKEILRMREVFLDFVMGDNVYKSTEKDWEKYFYYFTVAARK